jgi:hypothetical protein
MTIEVQMRSVRVKKIDMLWKFEIINGFLNNFWQLFTVSVKIGDAQKTGVRGRM